MREVKLVVWDLDDTLVDGVFDEGDRGVHPPVPALLEAVDQRGILQVLATQNEAETAWQAIEYFGWNRYFQFAMSDYSPKVNKMRAILDELGVAADHTAFVDEDAFERDAMEAQLPGIRACSLRELEAYVSALSADVTDEARRRPDMYRALRAQRSDESRAADHEAFLASCNIRVTVRPYHSSDADRVGELLRRTNRMNLGSTEPPEELLSRAVLAEGPRLVVAELRDRYGDSGRCGVIAVAEGTGVARIESIAISCRARARGLSLAILVGMLRHPSVAGTDFRCAFRNTGRNRPLRMLLWAAGFTAVAGTDELAAPAAHLAAVELPGWATIETRDGVATEPVERSPAP